jgi:hypothetical protein
MARCPYGGKVAMDEPTRPHPADFLVGSLASRAAARARLESFMPIVTVIHFEKDPNGTPPPRVGGLPTAVRQRDSDARRGRAFLSGRGRPRTWRIPAGLL